MGEPEPLDQVLVDALGIAPELKLLLDPLPVRLAGRAGLFRRPNRWPGWGFSAASAPGLLPAVIYSITGTCKLLKINPTDYLTWVLPRLAAATSGQADGFLPHNYAATLVAA